MVLDENVEYNVAIYHKKNIKSITRPIRHLISYPERHTLHTAVHNLHTETNELYQIWFFQLNTRHQLIHLNRVYQLFDEVNQQL